MEQTIATESAQREALTLHHLSSSQSFRVLWALEELSAAHGLQYTIRCYKRINGLAPPEMKKIHPLGKSPILVVDGQSPLEHTVRVESRLILRWLSETYEVGMWTPKTAQDSARDALWEEFGVSTLNTIVNLALSFEAVPPALPFYIRPIFSSFCYAIANFHLQKLGPGLALMEDVLTDERPWFAGPKLGLSDINLVWPIDVASQRGWFDAKQFPKVAAWHQRIHERPAYKRALEKGGSYDLITFDYPKRWL
ncbi:putative glutathione S-transferase [Lophium mytilinum]|uniref:Putative glutathione S-transferase n=1 Tax=Lophium mytilinum TaxID=390894 RepID=A0A6A6QDD8_9PEZI|nr:putative glutathione S-transferase [Lophium mytilinum]